MTENKRYILDCRQHPKSTCSVAISGSEQEVLDIGEYHVTSKHGYQKGPELRQQLRSFMKEESFVR